MKRKIWVPIGIILILIIIIVIILLLVNKKNDTNATKLYNVSDYQLLENNINLLSDQTDVDDEIMTTIESGNYTLDDPYIIVNPYQISPLTAIVGFKTTDEVSLTIVLKAKEGGKDLVYTTPKSTVHYIPVYGLYMDYNNQLTITTSNNETQTISIPTEKTSDLASIYFPDVNVITNKLSADDNDFYFVSTPLGHTAAAYDQTGEVRWFLTDSVYKQLTTLSNGHFLLSSPEYIENSSLGIIEVDMLGKIYNSYELNNPYLDNYTVLDNNHLLYSSTDEENEGLDDEIVELNLNDGSVVTKYSLFDMLSEIDSDFMNSIKDEWGTINSLDYDAENDAIIVSSFYYSTVISIDYKTNKINWILANPTYFSSKFSKYLLTPTSSDFTYPMGDYNTTINDNVLSLMSNGWDMTKTLACSSATGLKSYAADYKIDYAKKTISESWSYGKDDNYFSYTFGDYINNDGERTVMFGRNFRSYQTDLDSCILSDEGDFYSTIITLDSSSQEIFKMTISSSYNSINKLNIVESNYKFAKQTINTYLADQDSDTYEEVDYKNKFASAIDYSIPLELNSNQLSISINTTDEYKVVLMDEYGNAYVYASNADNVINLKKGLGNLLVLIEQDDKIYNTGYYLNI